MRRALMPWMKQSGGCGRERLPVTTALAFSLPRDGAGREAEMENPLHRHFPSCAVQGMEKESRLAAETGCVGGEDRCPSQGDYLASFSRISTRRIFPLMVLGSSSTNSMTRGYL